MNIQIMSHNDALKTVKANHKKHHVIFITNPGDPFYRPDLHNLAIYGKKMLICQFMDIELKRDVGFGPEESHIKDILKFATDKDDIICCCHAGVSRSSAVAYVIKCMREDPKEAAKILVKGKHQPNSLIVKHGATILEKPDMITVMEEWKSSN